MYQYLLILTFGEILSRSDAVRKDYFNDIDITQNDIYFGNISKIKTGYRDITDIASEILPDIPISISFESKGPTLGYWVKHDFFC